MTGKGSWTVWIAKESVNPFATTDTFRKQCKSALSAFATNESVPFVDGDMADVLRNTVGQQLSTPSHSRARWRFGMRIRIHSRSILASFLSKFAVDSCSAFYSTKSTGGADPNAYAYAALSCSATPASPFQLLFRRLGERLQWKGSQRGWNDWNERGPYPKCVEPNLKFSTWISILCTVIIELLIIEWMQLSEYSCNLVNTNLFKKINNHVW